MNRRLVWFCLGIITALQALFGLVTLVWPEGNTAKALMVRLELWRAAPVWMMQLFLGVPLLAGLFWTGRGLTRRLLALSLGLSLLLPAVLLLEISFMHRVLLDPTGPNRDLRALALARWADAALGLAALIALRLAARAETLERA